MTDIRPIKSPFYRTTRTADHADVICPACGFDFVRPIGAWTRIGSDPYEAAEAYDGTAPLGATGYRRSALVVGFECESNHRFAVVFQAHKGMTYLTLEQWRDVAPEPEDDQFGADLQRWSEDADARVREHRKHVTGRNSTP